MNSITEPKGDGPERLTARLQLLTPAQVLRIDELLAAVGEYGEVHLIVQKGQLRFMNKVESFKAWDEVQYPKK